MATLTFVYSDMKKIEKKLNKKKKKNNIEDEKCIAVRYRMPKAINKKINCKIP